MAEVINENTHLGRLAVEQKFITQSELSAALDEQRRLLREESKRLSLSEVMLKLGYLTRTQLQRLTGGDLQDSISTRDQQIPGYQILQRLGQGAMATVYKAKQLSLDRMVAIKVLSKKLGENEEFVRRFEKEGRAAAKLNHNNIVQAIDVGNAGPYHYFVMELIDGKTVYDDLAAGKVYSEKAALDIVIQVARALEHAAARGFVHRDVKPKNIMIAETGVAKLADMGLAREMSDGQAAQDEAGRAYGTPYYISPEQIKGEIHIDFRADIYSLGATFYHMVTGKLPFDGTTPASVMHKHLKEDLIPPDHVVTTLSKGIGEVIEMMMAKNRNERYSSLADLITDLEAIRNGGAPLIAHKRGYDTETLRGLAGDNGQAVPKEPPPPEEPSTPAHILVWMFVLGGLLGISGIVNIVLITVLLRR